jgi:hypothetical protein
MHENKDLKRIAVDPIKCDVLQGAARRATAVESILHVN